LDGQASKSAKRILTAGGISEFGHEVSSATIQPFGTSAQKHVPPNLQTT
jgi:hypothetical protein